VQQLQEELTSLKLTVAEASPLPTVWLFMQHEKQNDQEASRR
jgi:hypothetical protein